MLGGFFYVAFAVFILSAVEMVQCIWWVNSTNRHGRLN